MTLFYQGAPAASFAAAATVFPAPMEGADAPQTPGPGPEVTLDINGTPSHADDVALLGGAPSRWWCRSPTPRPVSIR